MAEQMTTGGDHDPEHLNLDTTLGTLPFDVTINIGHQCSHPRTNNRATGPHARNIHVMDGGSNNHVGNDSHDDSTAISGTIHGRYLDTGMRKIREVRASSMPLGPGLSPDQAISDLSKVVGTPPSFHLRPPFHTPTGRQRSKSALSHSCLQGPEISKLRSSSVSALARNESRSADVHPRDVGLCPYTAIYPYHPVLILAHSPYSDNPPHQDVEIQYIHCEPEAPMQTDCIDRKLLGRVIELSDETSHLHGRTMIVMAIPTGARSLQCLHICHHPEMLRNSAELYEAHVAVVEGRRAEDLLMPGDVAVIIDDPETYGLRTHCYINYQHVWTVRGDVIFRNIGSVADFPRLKHDFREAQRRLYEDE